jgi:hypothetical protein
MMSPVLVLDNISDLQYMAHPESASGKRRCKLSLSSRTKCGDPSLQKAQAWTAALRSQ